METRHAFVERCAEMTVRNDDEMAHLHSVSENRYVQVVQSNLRHSAAQTKVGTPWHLASHKGHMDATRFLVKA